MHSNEELMRGILERKKAYQAQKQFRHLAIAGTGLGILLVIALIFAPGIHISSSNPSQGPVSAFGATILGPEAEGYVIVALLAFALGVVVTSAIRKRRGMKTAKLILGLALSFVLLITMMPVEARAEETAKTITGLGTGAIGNPAPGAGGWSYVYFGTFEGNAMKYRVLTIATTDFGGNTMLLDCDSSIVNMSFNDSNYVWESSGLQNWLNGRYDKTFYQSTNVFTVPEKAAIASSTKGEAAAGDGDGWERLRYAPLTGEHIFILDAKEATRPSYGYARVCF